MDFILRLEIAWNIIQGKTQSKYGKRTICQDFMNTDGSPSYHQSYWELELHNGTDTCSGTVRINKPLKKLPPVTTRNPFMEA